ncbi:hypothetical protein CXB51_019917 [Gossypium anomalum]|uniref:RNase H type-1 domain-containing protein n=1 Tax=Gossypium anomalum TaxID=47600 RepID=A0A8J5YTX5_9ROSI|nr:hypothetical protein CXB51_019917 [Gossypium anomalum]
MGSTKAFGKDGFPALFYQKYWHIMGEERKLGDLKEDGGMGFRVMSKFNIALLAKQGWGLLCNPDSLLARSLKAKYYPHLDFLQARLGNLPSFTWRSLWAIKDLLEKVMCWRVESELIEQHANKWKEELIRNTFHQEEAEKILYIPFPSKKEADSMVWSAEASGTYTVCSEALACVQATQFGAESGFLRSDIEVDALSVVKKVNNEEEDRSEIRAYIIDAKRLKKYFISCRFKHAERQMNKVAHHLAKEGINKEEDTYLRNGLPSLVTQAVEEDKRNARRTKSTSPHEG